MSTTEVFDVVGAHEILISGKKNFTAFLIGRGGGGSEGFPTDNGGGGGGGRLDVVIPNADLIGITKLTLVNGDAEENTTLARDNEVPGIYVMPGAFGDFQIGGAGGTVNDGLGWATNLRDGGSGFDASGILSGGGGGGSGGSAADGNDATSATGAVAVTGGGGGGNGGAALGNGTGGATPGGGGGGKGDGGASAGGGGNARISVTYDVVTTPVITSNGGGATASVSVQEGNTAVTTVAATGTATIAFSISGGADAAKFAINSSSGVLTFVAAPDYEVPTDANTDNAYVVIVKAANTDAAGNEFSDTQTITVTVTNDASDDGRAKPNCSMIFGLTIYG